MAPTRTVPDREKPPQHGQPDLALPHERDETSGPAATGAGAPTEVMEQARRDIESGQVDTDMRNPAGLDAEQRKKLGPTPTRAPKP